MARFQVRKRDGRWEVVVLAPGRRSWEVLETFFSWKVAMALATGQLPYGPTEGLRRTLRLDWV